MSLFDPTDYVIVAEPVVKLSADARRTRRARVAIAGGKHPANGLPVDTDHHCRDCAHLVRLRRGGSKTLLKCDYHRLGRSFSAASDMRASWPACPHFEATA